MSAQNDGGPAFPETRWDDKTRQEVQWCGMTLRQWYMGKALESIDSVRLLGEAMDAGEAEKAPQEIAKFARLIADAMMKEAFK